MSPRLSHDRRLQLLALAAGLPGIALGLGLLWAGDIDPRLQWTLTIVVVGVWWAAAFALRERIVRPLQTLSNLLAALREGDYSLRARRDSPDDALGLAYFEANALGDALRRRRLDARETAALLGRVMEEIDVAVFAFDAEDVLRVVNRAGADLLDRPADTLPGRRAEELGLARYLTGEAPRTVDEVFPGGAGRWEVRRSTFRQEGLPHRLLVLADLSRALREEEREAWKRLVRVLGHEINNSLAPIQSIADSLTGLVERDGGTTDGAEDLRQGLEVISGRARALSRFMASYARLARLPEPEREPVDVGRWVRGVAKLEARRPVEVRPGRKLTIEADADQLEQLLINLVQNAADAAGETGGGVEIGWEAADGSLEVRVEDEGPGLPETANLFVPFFTTKPEGSGIGLALSRQIAEAHGGTLTLEDRRDRRGARARLRLPL